jgi:hypothetical protein
MGGFARIPPVKRLGTRAAKRIRMFELTAFVLASGSVLVSVFFACRQDIDTRGI